VPTQPPTEPPVTKVGTATVYSVGDVLMHMSVVNTGYNADTGEYDQFHRIFDYVTDYTANADLMVGNLETTLAGLDNGYQYNGYPNFNCPDEIVSGLKEVGFDMLLTANNHTYDTQTTGFFRTQQIIQENGMEHIGTKPTAEDDNYLIKEIDGVRVGMVCYTYGNLHETTGKMALNGGAPLPDNVSPLINTFLPSDVAGFSTDLREDIDNMRSDGAEAIVLYIHWGEEYQTKQNNQQKAMAQAACDLGVDVIVGGHPHVIQPLDLLTSTTDDSHKTVCLYSTGNALSNQRIEHMNLKTGHTEDGIFFSFTFVKYSDDTVRVENVEVLPLWVNLYTSTATGKAVYDILPLDKAVTDWKTAFTLTDSTLTQAEKSYERTMKIVGTGLEKINEFLSALPEIE
jgi:poly-gamma-glutamate synthesis protein (capsule biosynthesis protein)